MKKRNVTSDKIAIPIAICSNPVTVLYWWYNIFVWQSQVMALEMSSADIVNSHILNRSAMGQHGYYHGNIQ